MANTNPQRGSSEASDEAGNLFESLNFYVSPSLRRDTADVVRRVLTKNGASLIDREHMQDAEYIMTDSHTLERDELQLDASSSAQPRIVTVAWLWSAIWAARLPLPDPKFYSTDPQMIFSGVVACCSDIPNGDREAIAAGIQALGGQYRYGLTKDVTHLFVLSPEGPKYEAGMKYFSLLKQPAVVTPHWFDDSFKCARPQPLERYLFPEPLVFKPELSTATSSAMNNPQHRQSDDVIEKLKKVLNNEIKAPRLIDDKEKQEDRHAVWASVAAASAHEQDTISKSHIPSSQGEEEGVWADRRILLSESLELASGRRESVNAQIVTRNGVVVDKIEATVTDYDILITTYCEGPEFRAATRARKIVGTLAWLFYVMSTGRFTSPKDHILHSPCPNRPIPELFGKRMTVTNYTGDAREYLKKLLAMLGVEATPALKRGETEMCIAAFKFGQKTERAEEWGIPTVNHLWVEECFKRWAFVHPATESGRFVSYPPGINYAEILGQRGIGNVRREVLDGEREGADLDPPKKDLRAGDTKDMGLDRPLASTSKAASPKKLVSEPPTSNTSSVAEVEERTALGFGRDGTRGGDYGMMDVDDNWPSTASLHSPRTSKVTASPHKKNISNPRHSTPTPKSAISNAREASIIDLDLSPKFVGTIEVTPLRSEKSKGKMRAPAPPPAINLSEDDGSDVDLPSAQQLWQGTQARKSITKASSPRSSSLTPPPGTRAVRPRSDDSGLDSPPAKKARRRKAVDSLDDESDGVGIAAPAIDADIEIVEQVQNSKANGALTTGKTHKPPLADSPKEWSRGSVNTSPSKHRLHARHSEPSPSSPHQMDATPSKVKASASLGNGQASSKHSLTAVTKPIPARSAATESPDRTVVPAANIPGGGRVRRQAATKAAVSLAADVQDMNAFQADFARSKGDPRKLSLMGLRLSGPQSTGRLTSTNSTARRSSSSAQNFETDDADADTSTDERDSVTGPLKRTTSSNAPPRKLKPKVLLTKTGYKPEDTIYKKFAKLVNLTEDPDDCAFVVCPSISRTEKFVRAMPNHPAYLNASWMKDSAEAVKLQDPKDYLLQDRAGEKRWGFKLADALERAKAAERKIFHGYTFYVTKNVQLEFDVIQRVVDSAGGKAHQTSHPHERLFAGKPNTLLISCLQDKKEWINLAMSGMKIYTVAFILNSVLTQAIDWTGKVEPVEVLPTDK